MHETDVRDLLALFPEPLRGALTAVEATVATEVEEIRVGQGRPLLLVLRDRDVFVGPSGELSARPERGLVVEEDAFRQLVGIVTEWSLYALEEELRAGFLTLPGGHRVGLAGRGVVSEGRLRTLRDLSSLNIRLTREIRGVSLPLLPHLARSGELLPTLLVSPPRCGKTTLLRDLVCQVSLGREELGLRGRRVTLVDERSEIAGMAEGRPRRDVGPRTDVLDGVPKAEGMMMAIRALGPEVLACDEIGRPEDTLAVLEAVRAGVVVLATAHGGSLSDLEQRPSTAQLVRDTVFRRIVVLGRSLGPGTVEFLTDEHGAVLTKTPFRTRGREPVWS